jgi:hypothetical protein
METQLGKEFYLVFTSRQWYPRKQPVAIFWKEDDFNKWVEKIGDIHEAYEVYKMKRNEDGTLEMLEQIR